MGWNRFARSFLVAGLVVVSSGAACTRVFHGAAIQPNPLASPTETLRDSEKIVIITGDMELEGPGPAKAGQRVTIAHNERYPLHNEASFTMVSRDRLRFHVQLEHKWQEFADLKGWKVYLEDDQGNHYAPEALEHARTKLLVSMWDREVRSVDRNQYGDITAVHEDGWKSRQTLGSLAVFRGNGDFVFYKRDLFSPDVRWIKLVVKRSGEAFEFRWDFKDGAQVANGDVGDGDE